jgi:filamentous hemagglutinin family protein
MACLLAAGLPRAAAAQHITVDGRLSPAQTLTGPNYAIGANLGKQVGSNLFQSFGRFGLTTGESATFSGGQAPISNVIGRVTGGSESSIDGKIQSTIAGANLYLINPSGVVFGPNATVSVSGSFHVSTADYLKMSDGAKFQATNPDGSTMTMAPPAAFGFLTASRAKISVNGSTLGPVPGTLGLVGGPVSITAGATLKAPSGTIHVTSVAGAGEVPVDPRNTAALTVTSFGPVSISGGSTLDVSNRPSGSGGSVLVHAGALTIDASTINADNYGSTGGGGTVMVSAGSVSILDAGMIWVNGRGSGNAGSTVVTAGSLSISSGGQISGSTFGSGKGGSVSVAVTGQLTITGTPTGNGTGIAADSEAGSTGNAGTVTVKAGALSIFSSGEISSSAMGTFSGLPASTGNAGQVTVTAGTLSIVNGGAIVSNTSGPKGGGSVAVTVFGQLTIDGSIIAADSGAGSTGDAGTVIVTAGTLSIAGNGSISSTTFASGNGGDVEVKVTGQLSIDASLATKGLLTGITAQANPNQGSTGNAGQVAVHAGSLSIVNGGAIVSNTSGPGHAGGVAVMVDSRLTIDGSGSLIASNSEAGSTGNAGNVTVTAGTLSIATGGAISSGALGASNGLLASTGSAGNVKVTVTAGTLSIASNGLILSTTSGSGHAGSVAVTVPGQLTIDGLGSTIAASSEAGSTGDAGTVTVTAGTLSIANNGTISSTTFASGNGGDVEVKVTGQLSIDASLATKGLLTGITAQANPNRGSTGNAGQVTVHAGSLSIVNGGVIATTTGGPGKGGDVDVIVASDITLRGPGPQITAKSTGGGNAGSITVSAFRLLMNNGAQISTEAETSTANGGNITLTVRDFLYLVGSKITTSVNGETGNGGNIEIDPRFLVLDSGSSITGKAVEGHGGNIQIGPGQDIISADSIVTASSQLGISGTIQFTSPQVDVNGALVVQSSKLRSAAQVLRNSCVAQANQSSLVPAGRGGVPHDPDATLPALYLAGRDVNPSANPRAAASDAVQTNVRLTMRCG